MPTSSPSPIEIWIGIVRSRRPSAALAPLTDIVTGASRNESRYVCDLREPVSPHEHGIQGQNRIGVGGQQEAGFYGIDAPEVLGGGALQDAVDVMGRMAVQVG